MPTTALIINNQKLMFMTVPKENGTVDVDIFICDENFEPTGTPSIGYCDKDEETYHKELRKEAHSREQFVPEYSTDPQWSPGYVEPIEESHE